MKHPSEYSPYRGYLDSSLEPEAIALTGLQRGAGFELLDASNTVEYLRQMHLQETRNLVTIPLNIAHESSVMLRLQDSKSKLAIIEHMLSLAEAAASDLINGDNQ